MNAAEREAFEALIRAYQERLDAYNARHGASPLTGRLAGANLPTPKLGRLLAANTHLGPEGTLALVWTQRIPARGQRPAWTATDGWTHVYAARTAESDRRCHPNEPDRVCADCSRAALDPAKVEIVT